jgi:hypothetical protein
MQLADYRMSDTQLTTYLEAEARDIQRVIQSVNKPLKDDLQRVWQFLLDVERWKADCMEERTGNAVKNNPRQIWEALRGAIDASSDLDALLSIMNLVGFGSYKDENTGQRRAKRATAVLRFLNPDQWGTVDWRTIAILTFYKNNHLDMEIALQKAKKENIRNIASLFDLVDEKVALNIVQEYRRMRDQRSPRTVDVELALYGASFLAWPRP